MRVECDETPARPVAEEADDAVERLARILKEAKLDCWCRVNLTDAIETFRRLEAQRREKRSLDQAFRSRKEILGLMVYLEDLDRIMSPDFDARVCAETAQVFDDIASAAHEGAESLRRLCARTGE